MLLIFSTKCKKLITIYLLYLYYTKTKQNKQTKQTKTKTKIMVCKANMYIDKESYAVVYTKEKKIKHRKGNVSKKHQWNKEKRERNKFMKRARESKDISNNVYSNREYTTVNKEKKELYTQYDFTKEYHFTTFVCNGNEWYQRKVTVTEADIQLMELEEYKAFLEMYNEFLNQDDDNHHSTPTEKVEVKLNKKRKCDDEADEQEWNQIIHNDVNAKKRKLIDVEPPADLVALKDSGWYTFTNSDISKMHDIVDKIFIPDAELWMFN